MNIDLWYDLLSESEAEQKAFAEFQTKLTYGMICYIKALKAELEAEKRFKLS